MHFLDIILKKRSGHPLSTEEIQYVITGYVQGKIPDYQVAALLMAVWFNKMDERETADLTFAMRDSGETVDLSDLGGKIVDKHSTGGVADTTTLITAPIAAACGLQVAKMSGRGLGHTGGTLDKLESIPGLNTSIEMDRFKEIVQHCGMAIIGQTKSLVPADKLLYALRDVTGTIDNISLISASIMSKKLACGADAIVLDVKTGNGAFMKEQSEAVALAKAMVGIGKIAGKKTTALVTDMNQPLGNAIGNSLEVQEAIELLQGRHHGALRDVALALASRMLLLAGEATTEAGALTQATDALTSGKALKQLAEMIEAQGGNSRVCEETDLLPTSRQQLSVRSPATGYITDIATNELGMAALLLGAGRATKSDIIDPAVGIWMKKRHGEPVKEGDELAVFHVNDSTNLEQAKSRFLHALQIGPTPPATLPLIHETIS